ncbi:MutS protein 1 [Coemansia sp. RSA 2706]|nr:MutS protein 1 [Coemansia sp. RSA 2706]KAJ2311052.1 MutS protein 1 [Coemansia sp. RSA 2705]KAJ2318541.1 MutS protein 1 [Coemansia sp. RSA 2704]
MLGRAFRGALRRWARPPALVRRSTGPHLRIDWAPGTGHVGVRRHATTAVADPDNSSSVATSSGPNVSASSVLSTVREYRQKYPECTLLVRVGDFYELYYEQADDVGSLLGLQVVDKKFKGGTVRFTGFPAHTLLRHLHALVARHQRSVAICEQFQEPMRRAFTRRVTRVVTPGTLIDDECLATTRVHNYILCIASVPAAGDGELGLAWLDLATGDFMAGSSTVDALSADLARIRPQEIVVDRDDAQVLGLLEAAYPPSLGAARPAVAKIGAEQFASGRYLATDADPAAELDPAADADPATESGPAAADAASRVDTEHLVLAASELSAGEQRAARALLGYVQGTQLGLLPPLQPPRRYAQAGHMRMGAATIQALELVRPITGGDARSAPTLLTELDSTRTSAGARLLAERLTAPSTSLDIIEQRLDLVEFFCTQPRVRSRIHEQLESVGDVERAVNKLSLNCGGPHDLLAIAGALRQVAKIKRTLRDHLKSSEAPRLRTAARKRTLAEAPSDRPVSEVVHDKARALQALAPLARAISAAIRDDAERDPRAFGFLKRDCCAAVTRLHADLAHKERERAQLQERWQLAHACASLRLDSIPALGHFVEVSKRDAARLDGLGEFRMIQSLKSKVRFEHAEWTYLLSEIELLRSRIQTEELRVFEELRDRVLAASTVIRTNSRVLAALDVAIASAAMAAARQYTRPRLSAAPTQPHCIENGRHPVVEAQLLAANRQYVANDCAFDAQSRVLLLTGPNMGGKSTYLRQIALTSVLAQIGCFVPADRAHLHIVDAIYSRIGAHDNLALDQSTFMVEMRETAEILRHATGRSLVILDEIGRGTATADGAAIAFATLKYLHDCIGCKAVFATHYHELVPQAVGELGALRPLQTAIFEDGQGGFSFLHRVKPGICSQSHALYVAQIAGIPKQVLALARAFKLQK